MFIFKNKGYIILIGAIIFLLFFTHNQNYRYKSTVGGYDVLALSRLRNEIKDLLYSVDNNKLTNEMYLHHREVITTIIPSIGRSPNIGFMEYYVDRIFDSNDSKKFIEDNLNSCEKLGEELDILFKSKHIHDGISTYTYFDNEKHREEFLKIFQ